MLLLKEKEVELRSLKENIDTSSPYGKFSFHLIAALAELEHDIIVERTQAGLGAARARGRRGGRRAIVIPPKELARARELYDAKQTSVSEIMRMTVIGAGIASTSMSCKMGRRKHGMQQDNKEEEARSPLFLALDCGEIDPLKIVEYEHEPAYKRAKSVWNAIYTEVMGHGGYVSTRTMMNFGHFYCVAYAE